jgi:hypothetical protein
MSPGHLLNPGGFHRKRWGREHAQDLTKEALKFFSPYITKHLKRLEDYVVDLENTPLPFTRAIKLPI